MIKKRGEGLTLNTIVIAAIVLVVLVVLWFIFTGQIGRSAGAIDDVGDTAGMQVNEVTWCLSTTLKGQSCEVERGSCTTAIIVKKERVVLLNAKQEIKDLINLRKVRGILVVL